jgi:hypothetical protein
VALSEAQARQGRLLVLKLAKQRRGMVWLGPRSTFATSNLIKGKIMECVGTIGYFLSKINVKLD